MSDPKIIDWKARAEQAEAERDALAAHVAALIDAGEDMQDDYIAGETSLRTDGIDAWGKVSKVDPFTTLSRRDSLVKAEALEEVMCRWHEQREFPADLDWFVVDMISELRQQAKETKW